ncbi:hypothetical protein ABPG74_016812 [Tetrahymena malaccensis]
MLKVSQQQLDEQISESISDRKVVEEENSSGQNANQIPIFSTSKSVMYSNKSPNLKAMYNQCKQGSVSMQIIQGDCDCNLPTSPTQHKNFSENSSLKKNLSDQPQIINLFKVTQVQQKEGESKIQANDQESNNNMDIAQEYQSLSHSQKLRKQEISRVLTFFQQGSQNNRNENIVDHEREPCNSKIISLNNQNIGPCLAPNQNILSNSSESNQNQSNSTIPRQIVYQMNAVVQMPNQPSAQQNQILSHRQNMQQAQNLQHHGINPQGMIQNNVQQENSNNNNNNIFVHNFNNNDYGLGYFQLRHMLKILKALMVSMGITGCINLFILILSIIGLTPQLDSSFCQNGKKFIYGTLIPLCILSFFVCFLDFFGVLTLHKKEYQNLSKKQLSDMRLKVSDLQSCSNILRALHVKYPLIIVPQFFLKAGQFFVIIFSSIYYSVKQDSIKQGCSDIQDNGQIETFQILQTVLLVNLLQYLTILVLYSLAIVIRSCIAWKKRYDAQNLRNIRNCKFFKYKNVSQLGKCEGQCIICYSDYQIDEDLAELPCNGGHIFHKACIGYWLEINQCCPTCKQTI